MVVLWSKAWSCSSMSAELMCMLPAHLQHIPQIFAMAFWRIRITYHKPAFLLSVHSGPFASLALTHHQRALPQCQAQGL